MATVTGVAAEFFLYDMPNCTDPATYVFGCDAKHDSVAHYHAD